MCEYENIGQIYDKLSKQWIIVTKSVENKYNNHNREIRRKQQENNLCGCPRNKFWLCDGCCDGCEFQLFSDDLRSMDYLYETDDDSYTLHDRIADKHANTECTAIDGVISNQALTLLCDIYPEMLQIGQMKLKGFTMSEIAETLGIKRTTLNSRISKAKEILKKDFPELF